VGGRRSRNRHESGAQRGAREIGDAPRTRRRRTRSLRHLGPSSRVRLTRDSVSQRPGGRCDSLERRPARRGAGLDARRYEARALVFRCGGRKRSGFTRLWQRRARDEWRGEQPFKEGQVLCGVRFWIALGLEVLISASRQRAANPTKEKRLTATLDSPRHTRSRRMLASRLTSLVRVSSAFRVHRRHTVDPARATRARTRVRSRGSRRPGRAEASFSLCRVPSSSETASGPLPA
jgi:hypothetical protein